MLIGTSTLQRFKMKLVFSDEEGGDYVDFGISFRFLFILNFFQHLNVERVIFKISS